jgi:hypothetical protein
MKYIRLFKEHNDYDTFIEEKNRKWNESLNDYGTWIPKMYSYWNQFKSTVGEKMSKLPAEIFQINSSYVPFGYGRDLKKLLKFMEDYKNPNDLVKYLDEKQKKKTDIRTQLEGRWDDILNRKGTKEEYKLMNQLRELDVDLSDLHWIWKTCFVDHNFEVYSEIDALITDFADDHGLNVYLSYVELFRGIQLGFLIRDDSELKISTDWNSHTREYTYTGIESSKKQFSDEIFNDAKKLSKRLEGFFLTVSIRPYNNMLHVSLANQID